MLCFFRRAVCICVLISLMPVYAFADQCPVSAVSAVLIDAETFEPLYEKGAKERMPPASLTKIMTAYTAIRLSDPDDEIIIPKEASGVEGSSAYLLSGERLTVRELLYAILLESANDAAEALAIGISGSVEAFVCEMNRICEGLGLEDTNFSNPHGLSHPEHYSTAYDMAVMLCHAMKDAEFAKITGTYKYTLKGSENKHSRHFTNHNRLLNSLDGVIGGKTGYTRASGRCLASFCVRDGVSLCAVTMNAPDDWNDHERLYAFGFTLYERILLDTSSLPSLTVCGGDAPKVTAVEPEPVYITVRSGEGTVERRVYMRRFEYAPVEKGRLIGYLTYFYSGKEIYRIPLFAENSSKKAKSDGFWNGSWKR